MNNTLSASVTRMASILVEVSILPVLFLVDGVILGIDLMVPMWVEVAGYVAEGLAVAWSALLILQGKTPADLVRSAA